MAMVFVGALNVGSISLHFDSELKTNMFNPYQINYGFRRDYQTGIKESFLVPKELNLADNRVLKNLANSWNLLKKEFDIKDIINEEIRATKGYSRRIMVQ